MDVVVETMKLIVKEEFDAAHYLYNYVGKCSDVHGHCWLVEAYFIIPKPKIFFDKVSMDFGILKKELQNILPDHKYLNNVYDFNPTAENIAIYIFNELKEKNLPIQKIVIWESKTSGVEYEG